MGSTFVLSVRICQRPLFAFLNQRLAVFTSNAPKCKWQPSLHTRYLCTKQRSSADGLAKRSYARHPNERLLDTSMTVKGKSSTFVRQTVPLPKSVFAAGTAKRTAEMLRRKLALRSQDEDQIDAEGSIRLSHRAAGKDFWLG